MTDLLLPTSASTLPPAVDGAFVFDAASMSASASREFTHEEWVDKLHDMQAIWIWSRTELLWYMGDMLNIGEVRFSEDYVQVIEVTGYAEQTLRNCQSMCRKFPAGHRQAGLTMSMHDVVRALPEPRQTAWLEAAQEQEWGTSELRDAVKAERGQVPDTVDVRAIYTIKLTWPQLNVLYSYLYDEDVDADLLLSLIDKVAPLWQRAEVAETNAQGMRG